MGQAEEANIRFRSAALIVTLALGFLLAPLAADAQQAGKVPRVGYLQQAHRSAAPYFYEAFWQGLHELGYVEGQNIAVEYRAAEGAFPLRPRLCPNFA